MPENRLTINNLIDSIKLPNKALVNTHVSMEPLFVTRRLLLVHGELQIYNQKVKQYHWIN